MTSNLWTILGIAPTDNRREIKRAYAKALKLIDIDANPEAFVALRDSYEHALYLSDQAAYDNMRTDIEDEVLEDETNVNISDKDALNKNSIIGGIDNKEQRPNNRNNDVAAPEAQDAIPVREDNSEDINTENNITDKQTPDLGIDWQHGHNLYGKLFGILVIEDQDDPESQFLNEEEEIQLRQDSSQFFQWLKESPILVSQAYEDDFAELITHTIPRSDTILGQAIEQFGWDKNGADWDRNRAIPPLLNRYEGNRLLGELMEEEHPLHNAYNELCGGGPKSSLLSSLPKKQIKELLQITDNKYPSVEAVFDQERVSQWKTRLKIGAYDDGSPETSWFGSLRFWILLLVFLSVVLRQCDSDESLQLDPETTALTNAESDIDIILKSQFDDKLSMDLLLTKNPKYYSHLKSLWEKSKIKEDNLGMFNQIILTDLNVHYHDAKYTASYEYLREVWDIYLEIMKNIQIEDSDACESFLNSNYNVDELSEPSQERIKSLMVKMLFVYGNFDEHGIDRPTSFLIPGDITRAIVNKTNYSNEMVTRALEGDGSYKNRCIIQKALIESLLENEGGMELLRIL